MALVHRLFRLRNSIRSRSYDRRSARQFFKPCLEELEDRTLFAVALTPTNWAPVGPAPIANGQVPGSNPVSGRITGIAADPANASVIYIAAAGGGVWKTNNGGSTWSPVTDNQPSLSQVPLDMGAIALAPSNSSVLYAGTGETNNSLDSYYGRGVLRSQDGGTSWSLLSNSGLFDRRTVSRIAVDSSNTNTVYVALANNGINGLTGNTGVWKSTDGGVTWTNTTAAVVPTSGNADFTDLVMDASNSQHLLAAVGSAFGNTANGFYSTTDGGAHWSAAGNFPTGTADGNIKIAISKSNSQVLYALIANPINNGSGSLREMLTSINGGTAWTTLPPPNVSLGTALWYDAVVAVDPPNSSTVYAGGSVSPSSPFFAAGVIESTDGGNSWTDIGTGVSGTNGPHADHHAFAFDANGKLLDGDDGGIWRLDVPTPGSQSWSDLNGNLQITQFYGIAMDPSNANIA